MADLCLKKCLSLVHSGREFVDESWSTHGELSAWILEYDSSHTYWLRKRPTQSVDDFAVKVREKTDLAVSKLKTKAELVRADLSARVRADLVEHILAGLAVLLGHRRALTGQLIHQARQEDVEHGELRRDVAFA